jgi:hypothetical protein
LCLLPLASAVPAYAATLVPWVSLRVVLGAPVPGAPPYVTDFTLSSGTSLFSWLRRSHLPLISRPALFFPLAWLWIALPLLGLLLGLLLLSRRAPRFAFVTYAVWLALTTLLTVPALLVLPLYAPQNCQQTCVATPVLARHYEPGLWMALGSLLLGWGALVGMLWLRQRSTSLTATTLEVADAARQRLYAGILSAGAVLWAVGLLALPWVTAGCSGVQFSFNHFVRGTCSGLDNYDVLVVGLSNNQALVWPSIELLSTVGVYLLIAVWLPRLSRLTWLWALGWPLLATVHFVVGFLGVQGSLGKSPLISYASPEPAVVGIGVFVCALGIALGWAGALLLTRRGVAAAFPTTSAA